MLIAVPALAQQAPAPLTDTDVANPLADPLMARVRDLLPLLNGGGDAAALFSAEFLKAVPEDQLRAVTAQLSASMGKALGVRAVDRVNGRACTVIFTYERGLVTMRMVIGPAAPYAIMGLLVTGTSAPENDLSAVSNAIAALPGSSGFALYRLGDRAPEAVVAHNDMTPLAIGSAFKLLILAELVRATAAGERKWSDLVVLDGSPLPGGAYAQKPAGTKVTIFELAGKMISVSDNSATDILLKALGRSKVEAMLGTIGVTDSARNRPLMSTLDMFKLKGIDGGAVGRHYLMLDEAGRRKLLDNEIAAAPLAAIDPSLFQDHKPVMIDTLEWYLSALDLARTLDWLRRNTEDGPSADARKILAANSGIGPEAAGNWAYVGYKGGSEPGVMNMTLLLQSKAGAWFALIGTSNNRDADIDQGRLSSLMTRAAVLAAQQAQ